MSQVIAGIYEIQKQIGSGGGGIVYLGRHLRLEKEIVLKADKRSLNTKPDMLRREVDMLKGLSHTYIPQVYDFVQEDGVVYTVMDFIGGESLDKSLERGELFSQPQVIRWACQLLEALSYLHSRPPYGILHGDIKPANIMLRSNGDICLIDYNIALALGEDGAVKVGYSLGYASPEHYGIEYKSRRAKKETSQNIRFRSSGGKSTGKGTKARRVTVLVGQSGPISSRSAGQSSAGEKHQITLDARSDIYSLGATLYHLISGHHPAEDAEKVEPLRDHVCSPQVAAIIQKAMAPDPEMRYQTADEMLTAFRQLHRRDKRVVRHRRCTAAWAASLSLTFLIGGASSFAGLRQMEQRQTALTLAEYSSNSLAKGDTKRAVSLALQAIPEGESILEAPVTAQARKALTDALGVYDLSDGFKSRGTLEFPSAPFGIRVSPEGTRFAVIYAYEAAIFDMESCQRLTTLPLEASALSDVIFLDENRMVYAGEQGVSAYDLNTQEVLWTGGMATALAASADGTVVAAVNRDEDHADLYHMEDGTKMAECSFGEQHMQIAANDTFANPKDSLFALNRDGTMLAVSFMGGGLRIFDLHRPDDDLYIYDESDYTHFEGGFCGKYFAFTADGGKESLFGLIDTEKAAYLGDYESSDRFLLKAGEEGIYLANGNVLVSFNPDTFEETELACTETETITGFSVGDGYVLTATDTPGFSFYDSGANRMSSEESDGNWDFVSMAKGCGILGNRNEPTIRLMELESHDDALLLSYDAHYAHDEARISHDRKTAMLFNYKNFRLYDMWGNVIAEVEFPDSGQIYDQQFRKSEEDSWLEVIWYDGTVRCYSAKDGSVILEEKKDAPSKDLYEEFYTDKYRIASSLHDAPKVYDLDSNREVAVLEKDGYLTYVTQTGEYIITEYVSTEGERYGLLLDDSFQVLARLPGLCDISDGMLVFDYESGNLRQSPLYSLEELVALGKAYEGGMP